MVTYDGTVREANGNVIQFIYGDHGANSIVQYNHVLHILEMDNEQLKKNYKFTNEELKQYNGYSSKDNDNYYDELINLRDIMRQTSLRLGVNYITFNSTFAIPVEIIIGLFVRATYSIKGKSTASNEAILYAGASSFSNKSTAVRSKGELKIVIPIFRA